VHVPVAECVIIRKEDELHPVVIIRDLFPILIPADNHWSLSLLRRINVLVAEPSVKPIGCDDLYLIVRRHSSNQFAEVSHVCSSHYTFILEIRCFVRVPTVPLEDRSLLVVMGHAITHYRQVRRHPLVSCCSFVQDRRSIRGVLYHVHLYRRRLHRCRQTRDRNAQQHHQYYAFSHFVYLILHHSHILRTFCSVHETTGINTFWFEMR